MGERVSGKATKKLVPLFESYYEDVHHEQYLVNWPMIKTGEKVGSHYTIQQVMDTLRYYFSSRAKHNLWDFLGEIDTLYRAAVDEERKTAELKSLLDTTKARLEKLDE